MSLRDMSKAESSGDLTPEQRKSLGLSVETTDIDGDLLSDFDVHGDDKVKETVEQVIKEEHEAYASRHDQVEAGDADDGPPKDEYTTLDDGTKICNNCGTVVFSPAFIDITDDELIEYMMGGRIMKEFDIGPITVLLRSLNESELDYCGELMYRDSNNDEFPTEIEYQNRFGFYRLVYSLIMFGRKGNPSKLPDPSSAKGREPMEAMFSDKAGRIKGYGHSLRVMINRKQQILENSIAKALSDEGRLKNF